MNFFNIQSLNTYTKNMEMEMKWQKRKSSSDFSADGTTTIDDWVRQQADEIREAQKDGSAKLQAQIDLKLNSGQKLTAEEKEYLRTHNPEAYQHVKNLEAEQESYERELKRCRTKDEVERVKMLHTAASLSAVNNIMNNPNIPENKKFELVMREHQKNCSLQESTREFVESGRYAKLPTEAERLKAEKDLKEAEEAERNVDDTPEETAKEAERQDGEKAEETLSDMAREERKDLANDILRQREMTRAEAELTPEALKVKRAKAQAAYTSMEADLPIGKTIDVKAE